MSNVGRQNDNPTRAVSSHPETPESKDVHTIHGVNVHDPYLWLENVDSDEVQRWIKEQNETTFEYLRKIPCRQKIRQRISDLWSYEKYGIPVKRGGSYFFTYNKGTQPQDVLYRLSSLEGADNVLIDPNQ